MSAPAAAVLLVGGLGTRMHPLTLTRPKHLLPVAGVPVLDLQLARLAELGITRVVLATARHADLVARHVAEHPVEGLEVSISDEGTPLGTGGGLLAAMDVLAPQPDELVVVVNGDLLTGHDLGAQLRACSAATDVLLHVRAAQDPSPFGTVDIAEDGHRVVGFREKAPGPPGTLVNAGTYVLRPRVLSGRGTGGELSWERDLLPALIEGDARVLAHRDEAWFADIGTPAALLDATAAALAGSAAGALPADFDPAGAIAADTLLGDGARVEGSSTGHDVRVGDEALVLHSILLDGVRVGDGAVLERCVVGQDVTISAGARLHDQVVADGATILHDGSTAARRDEGRDPR